MGDLAHFRKTFAYPGFERRKSRIPVVSLTRFVIFAADNNDVLMFGMRLQANIVIGIERIPIERIGKASAR
jgi:hypothetical protein